MLIVDPSSTCALCEEQYTINALPHCIPCGHVCCANCLNKIDHPPRCPFCREYFSPVSIRKFYVDFRDGLDEQKVRGGATSQTGVALGAADMGGRTSPAKSEGRNSVDRSSSPIDANKRAPESRAIEEKLARAVLRGQPSEILEVNKEAQNWMVQADRRRAMTTEEKTGAAPVSEQHPILRSLSYLTFCQLNNHVRVLEADHQNRALAVGGGLSAAEEALKLEKRRLQLKDLECEDLRNDCLRLQSELDMARTRATTANAEWQKEKEELNALLDLAMARGDRNSLIAHTLERTVSAVTSTHNAPMGRGDQKSASSGLPVRPLPFLPDHHVTQAFPVSTHIPESRVIRPIITATERFPSTIVEQEFDEGPLTPFGPISPITDSPQESIVTASTAITPVSATTVFGPPPIPFNSRPVSPPPRLDEQQRPRSRGRERSSSIARERSRSRPRERVTSVTRHRAPVIAAPLRERRTSNARVERPKSPPPSISGRLAQPIPFARLPMTVPFARSSPPSDPPVQPRRYPQTIDPATLNDSDYSTSTERQPRSISISGNRFRPNPTTLSRTMPPSVARVQSSDYIRGDYNNSVIQERPPFAKPIERRASEGLPTGLPSTSSSAMAPPSQGTNTLSSSVPHSGQGASPPRQLPASSAFNRLFFKNQLITHVIARQFMTYYSEKIGQGVPDLTTSLSTSESQGSWWQSVMTVTSRARRIGFGCGQTREVAENNCFVDAAHYVESVFPALWKSFVELEQSKGEQQQSVRTAMAMPAAAEAPANGRGRVATSVPQPLAQVPNYRTPTATTNDFHEYRKRTNSGLHLRPRVSPTVA